jgi:cobalt-precorrin 5A hydrolase
MVENKRIAIIALRRNLEAAQKIQRNIGGDILIYSNTAFREAFNYDSIIAIMSLGIATRGIAPLLKNKRIDPAVVVLDSKQNYAIPLIGGHRGANSLARNLSKLGINPIITTTEIEAEKLIVGIGSRRGVSQEEVINAIKDALSEIGASLEDVQILTTASMKINEKGILEAAKVLGKTLAFVPRNIIKSIEAPSDSKASCIGLNGVCEPCAIALSGHKKLVLEKKAYGRVTIAVAK